MAKRHKAGGGSKSADGKFYIFSPYITIKGVRIYRKNGGVFKIPIDPPDDDGQGCLF